MSRAIVFDLDDTLYRERRFALSGFAAVASHVHAVHGAPAGEVYRALARCLRHGRRPVAFQETCTMFGLPPEVIPDLVRVYRSHVPRLRLSPVTMRVLGQLRASWKVGVLTNGLPDVQARKSAALHLRSLVDELAFAESGGCAGKPAAEAFWEIARRLRVSPWQTVFVGDDLYRDVAGARNVGMKTIRIGQKPVHGEAAFDADADAVVSSVGEVPATAALLLAEVSRHVH